MALLQKPVVPMSPDRLIPLIVAVALFMENMDSTVIATSLPAIATAIGTNPLALKLAVTSYLLSLAIFIPASGWTADRFGARTVFRAAIGVFMLGSIGCAASSSLGHFVAARILQGVGGAMMTPVGRLILIRSVDKRELVSAMALVTMPALLGPMVGPPIGGFITTYFSWHWIFLINLPIGLVGIALITRFVENIRAETYPPFDFIGMVLSGVGLSGLAFGLSVAGLEYLPWSIVVALIAVGAVFTACYVVYARRKAAPVLDLSLFALPTFRASVMGGFLFRMGIGALPFLLPLLLQIGFKLTPFQSGLITFSSAVGSFTMKAIGPIVLRRYGFRPVLTVNALISAAFLAACASFTPTVPTAIIIGVLLIGGFFRSLQFTSINTMAYADVEPQRISRATSLSSVAQQLSLSAGVAIGALAVEMTMRITGSSVLGANDFPPAFLFIAAISGASIFVFWQLPSDAGAEVAGRLPAANKPSDQSYG
jgi:EmrB/QacA subfamily drug resistance transporter